MAPADNTPDFDSMTPEEIMAWMETLAKRQGVKSEELTTSADADIPEIDPSTVVIDEPGYVPYGEERPPKPSAPPAKSEPPMAAQPPRQPEPPAPTPPLQPRTFSAPPPRPQASEESQTPARPASPFAPRSVPQPPSGMNPLRPPSVPPNRPMPTPPSTPTRSTPDFSSRPLSQPPAQTPPAASPPPSSSVPPARPAPPSPSQSAPPPRPASPSVPPNPRTGFEPPKWLTSRPQASTPPAPPTPPARIEPEPPREAPRAPEPISGDTDAMAWLESLAADQGDSLFNLDLSALIGASEPEPEQPPKPVDTVSWLQNLTQSQGEDDSTAVFERPPVREEPEPPVAKTPEPVSEIPTVADPFDAGVDTMAWLENLARRQGAKDEELTTDVKMDIPVPENPVIDEPGYNPFSFDAPIERRRPPQPDEQTPFTLENPADWLDSLANAEGFDEDTLGPKSTPALFDDEDVGEIERAISEGTVSPEQMQTFLERQTDLYVEELGSEETVTDEDAPPVPADLPDWLLEQVGAPPAETPAPPVAEAAVETPSLEDIPDWLRADAGSIDDADFMNIFDDETADAEDSEAIVTEPAFAGYKLEIDRSDPWVEAFEEEQEEGLPDITELPGWYVDNVNDPERVAAVEQLAGEPALAEADLPDETELTAGTPVDVPAWATQGTPAVEAAVSDIPDWLREIESSVEPEDVPSWLTESMDEPAEEFDEPIIPEIAAPPAPEPVVVTLPPVQPKPEPVTAAAPVHQPAASADLQTARSHASSGNLDSSVASYEALIRANKELEDVVDDLTRLSKTHRGNPAIYRVLGDGLMRQGKLQAALDIYREALNQL